jgi:hypothetical protein
MLCCGRINTSCQIFKYTRFEFEFELVFNGSYTHNRQLEGIEGKKARFH